jgi:hypothetical protein
VLFIPSCPGYTGLTGALDRSDRCESLVDLPRVNCLTRVSLVLVLLVCSWSVWSWFVRFGVGFSFRAGGVLGVLLFQGLDKSLRLSRMLVV